MSLARKIFSNTAWQILGKTVTAVLGIISIKFITNYLSRSVYGEYTTIYDYTALFAIFADFGLFTIAVREMAHDSRKEMIEKIVGNVLSIRTILAIFALGLATLVAFILPAYSNSHIPLGVFIVSIATVIGLIAGTMSSILQYYLKMHWASIALSAGKIVTVGYIVLTIVYLFPNNPEAGFPHLLVAWIIGGLVTILITYAASNKLINVKFCFDFIFWKNVFLKALPYGLALVLGTMYFRMGTIVLSLYEMKDQIGYFGVPLRFLEILQIVPHYFMNSVLPILTISVKIGAEQSNKIIRYSLSALASLALPILVGGYLLSWPLTIAVSSPKFATHRDSFGALIFGSDIALKILLVAMAFTFLHVVFSYTLVAMGRQSELLWINAIVVVINIVCNLILAPRYGFIGTAISATISEISIFVILIARISKHTNNIWDFSFLGKTALSSLIMGATLYLTTDFFNKIFLAKSLLILVPLGAIIFGACMFLTKAISKEMIGLLKKTEPAPDEIN